MAEYHLVMLKRAYDEPAPDDGIRVLVERLWPRGLARERARIDEWLRDIAPSTDLRKWYAHDPARFAEFRARYIAELAEEPARSAFDHLRQLAHGNDVTLVFGARDIEHSNAAVLRSLLAEEHRGAS